FRRHRRAVLKRDGDRRRSFDDVIVGNDDAVAVPNESRSERLRRVLTFAAAEESEWIEEWIDFAAADRRFRLNVDDRRENVMRDDDDRRAPRCADACRNRRGVLLRRAIDSLRLRHRFAGERKREEDDRDASLLHTMTEYPFRAFASSIQPCRRARASEGARPRSGGNSPRGRRDSRASGEHVTGKYDGARRRWFPRRV